MGSLEKSHDQVGQLLSPKQRRRGANCVLPLPAPKSIRAAVKNSLRGSGQVCRALLTAGESELGSFQVPWSGSVGSGDGEWGQREAPGTPGGCGRLRLGSASPSHAQGWELSPEPFPAPGRCSGRGGGGGMGWRRSAPLRLLLSSSGSCYPWNSPRLSGSAAAASPELPPAPGDSVFPGMPPGHSAAALAGEPAGAPRLPRAALGWDGCVCKQADLRLVAGSAHNSFMEIWLGATGKGSKSRGRVGVWFPLGFVSPCSGEDSGRRESQAGAGGVFPRAGSRPARIHTGEMFGLCLCAPKFCVSSGGGAGGRAGTPVWLFAGNGHTVFQEWGTMNTSSLPGAPASSPSQHSATKPPREFPFYFFFLQSHVNSASWDV